MRLAIALPPHVSCVLLAGYLALWGGPLFAQTGSLRGTVLDSAGAPVEGADVAIAALRRLTRSDDKGKFAFDKLPAGQTNLSARRLGYEPQTLAVAVTAGVDAVVQVTLIVNPAVLSAVSVSSSEMRRRQGIEGFYRRTVNGLGQYITRDQIAGRWGGTPSDVLRNTPGVRLIRSNDGGYAVRFPNTSLSRFDCAPMMWIDGQMARGLEIDDVTLADVEGIEIYNGPASTPMQFSPAQGSNSCGTIVIWSRPPTPRAPQRRP